MQGSRKRKRQKAVVRDQLLAMVRRGTCNIVNARRYRFIIVAEGLENSISSLNICTLILREILCSTL